MQIDKFINKKKYIFDNWPTHIILGTSFYLLFALLSPFDCGRYLFIGLALIVIGLVINYGIWAGIIAFIYIILLQSPFPGLGGPYGDLGYNWFTIDLLGISLVHWLAITSGVLVLLCNILKGMRLPSKSTIPLLILLYISILELMFGLFWKLNWYRYITDVSIIIYLVVFFFIGIVFPDTVSKKVTSILLLTLPLSLAWGNVFLTIISRWLSFSPPYDTTGVYVITALFMCSFIFRDDISNSSFRRFSQFTLLIFLYFNLATLGTFALLTVGIVIFIIIAHWTRGPLTRDTLKNIGVIILLVLLLVISLNRYYEENPITRMKIEQVSTIYTSNLDPALMRHSTAVRFIEIINIWAELRDDFITLLFGRGAGSYFTDNFYPFPYLTESDYTLEQITERIFYVPHNNPGYVLLKNGIMGTSIWVITIVLIILRIILNGRSAPLEFSLGLLFAVNLAFIYGFGFKNSLLIGLIGGLYASHTWNKKQH